MSCHGRCAGCTETGSLKNLVVHVVACPDWAELYRKDPAAALGPAEEYDRWLREDRDREKQADLEGRIADTLDRRAAMLRRFRTVDILED